MWWDVVDGYTPAVVSLDWSFMNDLPPQELARTYAWYQNLLKLRAAALYDAHGLDLLPSLRAHLDWENSATWTSASLLKALDDLTPGFEAWSTDLAGSDHLPGK